MHNNVAAAILSSSGEASQSILGGDANDLLQVNAGDSVSLNISPASVESYFRVGDDLILQLIDGQSITLANWFGPSGPQARLYLSTDGLISEMRFEERGDGVLLAESCLAPSDDAWGPLNSLRFDCRDPLIGQVEASSVYNVGSGLFSLLGLGAVGLGAAVLSGGEGGEDRSNSMRAIDGSGGTTSLSPDFSGSVKVTGTGVPGETVVVAIGPSSRTVLVAADGRWAAEFPVSDLPADGAYIASAKFEGSTSPIQLTGGTFIVDLDPPQIEVTDGFKSNGSVENLAEYQDGVTLRGTTDPGTTVNITLGVPGHQGTVTRWATVNSDGTWTVTFPTRDIAGGEREQLATITAVNIHGQSSTSTEIIVLDTVAPPLTLDVVCGNDIVDLGERSSPIRISGLALPGREVLVEIEGLPSMTVAANARGEWSRSLPASTFPEAEEGRQITVTTTDAAGNQTVVTREITIDTVAPTLPAANLRVDTGADTILNAQERLVGLPVSGQAEAGSTVSVTMNGFTRTAIADQDGVWAVTFTAAQIPQGAIASVPVSVTARDEVGNTTGPVVKSYQLDTIAPALPADDLVIATGNDGILSAQERLVGLPISGKAEPGSTVSVTMNGFTRTSTAAPDGTWSVTFAPAQIPQGEITSVPVSVTARDLAGNTTGPVTGSYQLDTVAQILAADLNIGTGADTILNAQERLVGLPISGKAEAGSTVSVAMNGFTRTATADQNGAWSVTFTSDQIPQGDIASVPVSVTAQDLVGNITGPLTANYRIDTVVPTLLAADLRISTGTDTILNAQERLAGLPVSGRAEAGLTVSVTMNGFTRTATADQTGAWSVTFTSDQIPQGEIASVPVSVVGRDQAGNTSAPVTANYQLDTVLPQFPVIIAVTDTMTATRSITTPTTTEPLDFYRIDAAGQATRLSPTVTLDEEFGETVFRFQTGQELPNGSYLVIGNDDAAGNLANTLLVRNSTSGIDVDLTREGLNSFDLSSIDLTRAQDARLTISAQQLEDIVAPDNRLFVTGEASDQVTLLDVTSVSENVTVKGVVYDIYTLGGNGAQVLLEDELTRMII